jgi:hypothetical protein
VLHRALGVLSAPAHFLNRQLDGLLGRIGLGRVPGSLVVGIPLGLLAASTITSTLAAYEGRREAQPVSVAQIAQGRISSGLWVAFDAELLDGPHLATIEVAQGGGQSELAERVHYLVVDPEAPEYGTVVRFNQPIPELEGGTAPVRIDGTISQDQFNMRSLLDGWGVAETYPDLVFSENQLIAYGFQTPWEEPSWIGAIVLGVVAVVLILGAFVPEPVFRPSRLTPSPGPTPIPLAIHGTLPTPRGEVRLRGTPAQLEWMNVEDVARTRWRYWGAELGDIRRDVEDAVREHGATGERLVVHGPAGSVIWPIADGGALRVEAGEAFLGSRRRPALRVAGDGVTATLTFDRADARDAAAAALTGG